MKKYVKALVGLCFVVPGIYAYASGGNACSGTEIKILNDTPYNIGDFKCDTDDYTCTFTKSYVSPDPDNSVVVGSMRSRDGSSKVRTLSGKVKFQIRDGGDQNTLVTAKFETIAGALAGPAACTTHADEDKDGPKIEHEGSKKYKVKTDDKNKKAYSSKVGYIKYKVYDKTA